MAEKLEESIQRAVIFCKEITFIRQPMNIEITVTGKEGTVKNVWLPESDHLNKMSSYIDRMVTDIWQEEQDKKKEDEAR